ncbi:SCAN domain-containing protein 3-like [Acyrthosiphon pisum]|uniref:Integrase catalytic domain-containing protein n=1 Tax=Acyrthosiphon pisum TaxID=7029 RepID=A0A8R2NU77_ACYPI|nr:SCAN domain-containing protein 3-like [Acyrthosiphon pisum]
MESKFNEHLKKVIETKKSNSTFICKSKYDEIINYLKQLKLEKKINSKLMKKYDVMTVLGDEKLIMPITAEDLIDMQAQPDGDYKFICVHQDHLTKFVILRPLRHKSAEAVANVLLDIFTLFGAPAILQSDNGREFVNKIISELCTMWKDLKIVHGKPRHSQSQGSVERANQDIENMLATWLQDNKTKKWSNGLRFVQLMKNRAYHHSTKHSPYEAMFGTPPKIGLTSSLLPANIIEKLKTEEELQVALDSIEVLSNDNKNNEVICGIEKEDDEDQNIMKKQIKTRQTYINQNRKESLNHLKIQAKKMTEMSEKRFCQGNVGESVRVKIPDVDRARSDLRCVLGVIMSVKDNFYEIGTTEGKLQQLYSRNQFTICKEKFVQIEDIPGNSISLREAARCFSNLGGQGYDRCTCTQGCKTNKCKCRKADRLCNSKCHSSKSCTNK